MLIPRRRSMSEEACIAQRQSCTGFVALDSTPSDDGAAAAEVRRTLR